MRESATKSKLSARYKHIVSLGGKFWGKAYRGYPLRMRLQRQYIQFRSYWLFLVALSVQLSTVNILLFNTISEYFTQQ